MITCFGDDRYTFHHHRPKWRCEIVWWIKERLVYSVRCREHRKAFASTSIDNAHVCCCCHWIMCVRQVGLGGFSRQRRTSSTVWQSPKLDVDVFIRSLLLYFFFHSPRSASYTVIVLLWYSFLLPTIASSTLSSSSSSMTTIPFVADAIH